MPAPVSRHTIETFYQALAWACAQHDPTRILPFLHKDVEWTINGPVDVLTFCGTWRGPSAVLDLIGRVVPRVVRVKAFNRDELLVDGVRAAALIRLTGVLTGTG